MSELTDRYPKNNILEYPKLAPVRHYESKNPPVVPKPSREIPQPDKLLDTLDDLDNLHKICELLPPDLGMTVQAITDVLSKHTQGLIIMRLEHEIKQPEKPQEPQKTPKEIEPHHTEHTPGTYDRPETHHTSHTPEYNPSTPGKPGVPEWEPETHRRPDFTPSEETHHGRIDERQPWHPFYPDNTPSEPHKYDHGPIEPGEKIGPGKEIWPPAHSQYEKGGFQKETRNIYVPDGKTTDNYDVVTNDKDNPGTIDANIDDIFSTAPEVEISIAPTESLVDLARKGYMQDDADIKEHYTTTMTNISQRFFQVMTALAEDGNFLDYSDLMQDFDGTAVKTSDPNQIHLIDEICRNQVLYDQKLRQMNLTHTPEKTLVMTRAMTAAEGEREYYLQSDYKTNMPTIVAGLSNDILQKAREDSNKKYKQAAYNMYKFLDSATKYTQTMLNMKIDSAIAKAQLSNTGSDIFAVTPPPQPLADHVDDNFDATVKYQEKQQKMIDEQKKDSKKASELDNGINISGTSSDSGNSSSSSGSVTGYHGIAPNGTGMDVLAPHPNIPGHGVDRWAKYVVDAIKANNLEPTDDRISRIMRQIETESSDGDPGVTQHGYVDVNTGGNEARGLMQVIPPTFDANAFEGHTDPYNGYDSLLAAIHYIIGRYGEDFVGIGEGHGY